MPKVIEEFLDGLATGDAEKVWDWLDGDADAIHTMIERLCEHHTDMTGMDKDNL
jgi:hypothetical protein